MRKTSVQEMRCRKGSCKSESSDFQGAFFATSTPQIPMFRTFAHMSCKPNCLQAQLWSINFGAGTLTRGPLALSRDGA